MNPLSLLNLGAIKVAFFTALIAGVLGFSGGYYTKSKFVQAERVDQLEQTVKTAAQDVIEAAKTSEKIEAKVADSNKSISVIRREVANRLPTQEVAHEVRESPELCHAVDVSLWSFDRGTVRLLNAARTGESVDPAAVSDAESKAPSGIGIAQFVDNDLEIVGLYRELAERHDALVDWVESLLKEAAK